MQNLFNPQNPALQLQAAAFGVQARPMTTPLMPQAIPPGSVPVTTSAQLMVPQYQQPPQMQQPVIQNVYQQPEPPRSLAPPVQTVNVAQMPGQPAPAPAGPPGETPEGMTYISGRKIVNNVVTKIATPYSTGHIPCPYGCGRSFKHATQKAIHIRKVHTGERPFVCKQEGCGKAFYSSGDLKSHEKTHSGLKPFNCPICNKALSSRNALKVHTKALHTLDRPFKCEVPNCGMTYMTRLDLDRHMKKHNKWEQKEEKAKVMTLEKRTERAEKRLTQLTAKLEKKEAREAKKVGSAVTATVAGKLVIAKAGEVIPEGATAYFIPTANYSATPLEKLEVVVKRKPRKASAKKPTKKQLEKQAKKESEAQAAADAAAEPPPSNEEAATDLNTVVTGDVAAMPSLEQIGVEASELAVAPSESPAPTPAATTPGPSSTGRKAYKRKATSDPEAAIRAFKKKLLETKMREEYEKQGFQGSIPFQSWRRGLSADVCATFTEQVDKEIAEGAIDIPVPDADQPMVEVVADAVAVVAE